MYDGYLKKKSTYAIELQADLPAFFIEHYIYLKEN